MPRDASHAALLFAELADERVYRYMPHEPPASVAALATRYARAYDGPAAPTERWWNWVVFVRDDAAAPRAIGTVEVSLDGSEASLAYLFGPRTWGAGFATEACAAALSYVFAVVPHARVEALVDTRNARSVALARRLGFACVETLVDADRFKGSSSDEYRFALALEEAVPKLHVGETAPDFSATTETGAAVTRASALASGPAVLIFYPMDATPGCTAQLCAVRDDAARYAEAGVAVYGVNGGSAESHTKFVAKHGLTAPLLVDTGNAIATAYDAVIGVGPLKVVNRTVVGIARDGRIAFYERGSPATDSILAALR